MSKKISELPPYISPVVPVGKIPISINGVTYGIEPSQLINPSSSGSSPTFTSEYVTYDGSTYVFTITPNKKLFAVFLSGGTKLKPTQYTYTPALSTNNFEISDTNLLAMLDQSGTEIEIILY
jgi:hypothetical protein